MKTLIAGIMLALGVAYVALAEEEIRSQENWSGPVFEYATVRFRGDKTNIIWPDGTMQKVIAFGGRKRPEDADERMWCLTSAINIMAKKGFEFVHMGNDDVVMRRPAQK